MTLSVRAILGPDPAVDAILTRHHALMRSQSPEESCHVMTADALRASGAQVFAAFDGDVVLGIGALKPFGDAVELKSMHTVAEARGRGVGAAILTHLLAEARANGATAAYLETGTAEPFTPARKLYETAGFAECPPFGSYKVDPLSVFMMRPL